MKRMSFNLGVSGIALFVAMTGAAPLAIAQSAGSSYQKERAVCGHNRQDKAACMREAGAAQQASRRGDLAHADASVYEKNALARCNAQPAGERADCEKRIRGTGNTEIDGSVMGGGAIRETTTVIPAPKR